MERKLLMFYSKTCGKCLAIRRRIRTLQEEGKFSIDYEFIDAGAEKELVQKYRIDGVPTVVLLEDGKESKRLSGSVYFEDLLDLI